MHLTEFLPIYAIPVKKRSWLYCFNFRSFTVLSILFSFLLHCYSFLSLRHMLQKCIKILKACYGWLKPITVGLSDYSQSNNTSSCFACKTLLIPHKLDLQKPSDSTKHKNKMYAYFKQSSIDEYGKKPFSVKMQFNYVFMYVCICMFYLFLFLANVAKSKARYCYTVSIFH